MILSSLIAIAALSQSQPLAKTGERYHLEMVELRAPLEWKGDGYVVKATVPSDEQLKRYEPTFIAEWSKYPPGLISKVKLKRIVFGDDLSVDGQPRGAVPAFDGDTMYYDPGLGAYNLHYQRSVIHHEFFHMIDERMGTLMKDPEWSKLNAPDFHYGSGGVAMRTKGVGELTDKIPGFLTPYGTSAVEEDKAELYAHAVIDGPYVVDRAKTDPVVANKLALLKKRLAAFDPAMGDAFWKPIPGWAPPEKLPPGVDRQFGYPLVTASAGITCFVAAQDNFPPVPAYQWKLQRLQFPLKAFGMEDPRHGALSGPPATLDQFAGALVRCIDRLPVVFAERLVIANKEGMDRASLGVARSEYAMYKVGWRKLFQSAIEVVRPVIRRPGRDADGLLRKLDTLQSRADKVAAVWLARIGKLGGHPLFPDIPPSHWAWEAVQSLRDAGIVSGYPDGMFRG